MAHDLAVDPPKLGRSFAVSLCLETVEHLPEAAGIAIIEMLTRSTEAAIIFSAAQPNQPGRGHITCRTPDFWLSRFSDLGWAIDLHGTATLRLLSTLHWYRRNLFLLRPVASVPCEQDDLDRLIALGRHVGTWPTHAHDETVIGFPGQRPSFALDNGECVPPMPPYAAADPVNDQPITPKSAQTERDQQTIAELRARVQALGRVDGIADMLF